MNVIRLVDEIEEEARRCSFDLFDSFLFIMKVKGSQPWDNW